MYNCSLKIPVLGDNTKDAINYHISLEVSSPGELGNYYIQALHTCNSHNVACIWNVPQGPICEMLGHHFVTMQSEWKHEEAEPIRKSSVHSGYTFQGDCSRVSFSFFHFLAMIWVIFLCYYLLLHLKLESKITNLIMDCSFQN